MRILVVGAGAVGGYFGARFVAGGADVTFAVRSGTEAVLRESGLRVHSPLGDLHLQEPRLLDRESDAPFDLVLICTKLRDLEGGIDIAEEHLGADGLVAALQNGVESEDRLRNRLGAKRVLGAVAYIAAALERPGVVRHTGEMARLVVGLPEGGSHPLLDSLMAACRRAGIEAEVAADIEAAIWRKFVFLAPFAGLTASWRQAIGPLRENPNAWTFYGHLVREAVAVSRARKVNLPEDAADQVLTFTRGLPEGMKASMLHDLEAGRPLELHWLTGAVARLGAELGVETPASSSVTAELQPYADDGAA